MSVRFLIRDLYVKTWSLWTRNRVNGVFKRYRREKYVIGVIQCFKQTFFKSRRTLLLSATAALKPCNADEPSCFKSISDADLEGLLAELEVVKELSKTTLFCSHCGQRVVIGQRHMGIQYCACKDAAPLAESPDGWMPYMEADDVIIWRKQYKHRQGLYVYKVYGRFKDVNAEDFVAVQLDGAYRRVWDSAVASLSLVEKDANGIKDQVVMHWEVLWPRLFANRDYVYIRRHKEFATKTRRPKVFDISSRNVDSKREIYEERPSVHSNAKRKAREQEERTSPEPVEVGELVDGKVFVIMGRSCEHPHVPETKHAIRVNEYWSHMVVKTLGRSNELGMEFVLTYYDEPAVGGMPGGVAAWATGRAAPAFLHRMRRAAIDYRGWVQRTGQDVQELVPIVPVSIRPQDEGTGNARSEEVEIKEEDMDSSKHGPELNGSNGEGTSKIPPCSPEAPCSPEEEKGTRDVSTQTDPDIPPTETTSEAGVSAKVTVEEKAVGTQDDEPGRGDKQQAPTVDLKNIKKKTIVEQKEKEQIEQEEKADNKSSEEEDNSNGSWWRYLYPFYYFV